MDEPALRDLTTLSTLWIVSSQPRPNRLLLFAVAAPQQIAALPAFTPDTECSERGIVFGPGGLDDIFAFDLHAEAARRYFVARGIDRQHAFTPH